MGDMTIEDYRGYRRRFQSGKASRYIKRFHCRPGDKFFVVARKSNKGHNLDSQFQANASAILAAGGIIVGSLKVSMASAAITDQERATDRTVRSRFEWLCQLTQVSELARASGAIIIAESTDRFIRNRAYGPTKAMCTLQASESDLHDLQYAVDGVPLMTLLDPDATPAQVRSAQTNRGNPGRPKRKKNRRASLQPQALAMHEQGLNQSTIARKLNVPRTTVQRWLRGNE